MTTEDKKLTYKEFINVVSLLGVYVERLASCIAAQGEELDFWKREILEIKVEIYKVGKKTPWKRFDELEGSITGMNAYYQEKLAELSSSKRKKKESKWR